MKEVNVRFRFNYNWLSHDYFLGKMISVGISFLQMVYLLMRQPSIKLLKRFRYVAQIKPFYSMLSTSRLLNLYELAQETEEQNIKGDVVQCGVWNGGAAAMAARGYFDTGKQVKRTIWLFDSFEGLPPPSTNDKAIDRESYYPGICKGAEANVHKIFGKLGLSMENVRIVRGWLENTIQGNQIGDIALLHVDTDWYDSVKLPLDLLYDKVVPGGFIVVDDYWFHYGCKNAVNDFIKERGLAGKIELRKVDYSAVYFRKPY